MYFYSNGREGEEYVCVCVFLGDSLSPLLFCGVIVFTSCQLNQSLPVDSLCFITVG